MRVCIRARELSLRRTWLTDQSCKPLQSILQLKGIELRTLLLDYNFVRAQGGFRIARALRTNRTLQHVSGSWAAAPCCARAPLMSCVLVCGCCALLQLSLYENELGDLGLKYLSEGLRNNQSITHLNLSYNLLSDKATAEFSEALEANQSLVTLALEGNQFTAKGLEPMLESLRYNSSIQHLNLSHNPLENDGADVLSQHLKDKAMCTLKSLSVSSCDISDPGIMDLMAGVKSNTTLTSLQVADNPVSGESGTYLGVGIGQSRSLQYVDMSGLKLGDKPLGPVIAAVETNELLIELDVSGNNISTAAHGFVEAVQLRNTTLKTLALGPCDVPPDFIAVTKARVGERVMFHMWK